jgi:hypothetical protein
MAMKNIPNNEYRDNRMRGSFPLTKEAGNVHPPNRGPGGDRRMGSFPLTEHASDCHPPNEHLKFTPADANEERMKFNEPFPDDKDAATMINPGPKATPTLGGGPETYFPMRDR